MDEQMKILVTGGAGYVGGILTDLLTISPNKYDVTVYDNLLFETRYMKRVNFIYGDIRDTKKLSKIINNYDVVIWLAGMVGDGACAVNPALTTEVNLNSVKWLVNNYKGKIAFPSTCSIYGKNNDLIDEETEANPLSLYAATKLEAEKYIRDNSDNYIIFRLGTLFGLGDTYSRIRLDLVVNILSMRAALGQELTVFGGEQWRPLLHVRDAASAFVYAIDKDITGYYNLSMKNYTMRQLADEIISYIPNSSVKYIDIPFEDMRNYRVNTDKFAKHNWKPDRTVKFGVKDIYELILENRIKNTDDMVYSNAKYIEMLEKNNGSN